jgi:phosphatidylethanolamine-binding protein (PEBP) family uncharacterized protein
MRRAAVIRWAIVIPVLLLAGCGGSGSSSGTRGARVKLKSAPLSKHVIPARYTCDGANISPPLEWGQVPSDTSELVLAEIGLTPTVPVSANYNATIEWTVAGISPTTHKLNAGELPQGAYVGLSKRHTRHYNVCPKKGTTEEYQFTLYGVPIGAKVSSDFADEPILYALTKAGSATAATAEGALVAIYSRRK